MEFKIFQFKNSDICDYAFMNFDFALKHNFSLEDYECIYDDSTQYTGTDIEILEKLFREFNRVNEADVTRLEMLGFTGHSLSCSDIIILNNIYYYCDWHGWKDISEYISK